ncbi:MAG: hypothetical protein IPN43_00015 [Chitinophagaceae bacterium]|nr:hypothetical protein [Chitinophagaceae bacterium]
MAKSTTAGKYVYFFGGGNSDGNESMKNLLGGKRSQSCRDGGHQNSGLPVPQVYGPFLKVCIFL